MSRLEGYAEWLRASGLPSEAVTAHLEGATLLLECSGGRRVERADVDAAIAAESARGAPARRLRNLDTIGVWLMRWQAILPRERPPAAEPPRSTLAPSASADPACDCIQPDRRMLDDVDIKVGGPIIGAVGLGLLIGFGVWFAIMVELGLIVAAVVYALYVARWRCLGCQRAIAARHLAGDELRQLRRQQLIRGGIAAALLVGLLFAKRRWDEERAHDQTMQKAIETLESFGR